MVLFYRYTSYSQTLSTSIKQTLPYTSHIPFSVLAAAVFLKCHSVFRVGTPPNHFRLRQLMSTRRLKREWRWSGPRNTNRWSMNRPFAHLKPQSLRNTIRDTQSIHLNGNMHNGVRSMNGRERCQSDMQIMSMLKICKWHCRCRALYCTLVCVKRFQEPSTYFEHPRWHML